MYRACGWSGTRDQTSTVRPLQSLLGFGESLGAICVLIGSKSADVIRRRNVIRLRVSAKAEIVGSARFANDYMLRGAGVEL